MLYPTETLDEGPSPCEGPSPYLGESATHTHMSCTCTDFPLILLDRSRLRVTERADKGRLLDTKPSENGNILFGPRSLGVQV